MTTTKEERAAWLAEWPYSDGAVPRLVAHVDALEAMHSAFCEEMDRQHADCEAKRERAEAAVVAVLACYRHEVARLEDIVGEKSDATLTRESIAGWLRWAGEDDISEGVEECVDLNGQPLRKPAADLDDTTKRG
jgi:hypothetical protein